MREYMENSVLGRWWLALWGALTEWYQYSAVHGGLLRLSVGWNRAYGSSAVMGFLTRPGALPRAWEHSVAYRCLAFLFHLPELLLGKLYDRFQAVFDGSVAARFFFTLGSETPLAIGWVTLGIIATSYSYWNNMYALVGYLLLTCLFVVGGARRKSQRLDVKTPGFYPALYVAAVVLGWLTSYMPSLSFRFLFFHLTCVLCVVVVVSAVETPAHLMRLVGCATAAMAFIAAEGVREGIEGVPVNYSYTDVASNQGMPGRVYSMYENPNTFAQVLVLLIPLALVLLLASRTKWGRLGSAAALGLGVVAIGMTYSRSSWVGLAAALVVFLFFWKRKILPGLLLLGVACMPLLPDAIFNRILSIFNTSDSSTTSRIPLYEAALELLGRRPVQGAGLGTDVVREAIADLNTYHGRAAFVHSHNLFLQLWLETGLLGLGAFVAAMVSGVKNAVQAVRRPGCDRQVKLVTLGAMCAIVGVLVNSMADYIWNYPRVMVIFWFVFALMLAGMKLAGRGGEETAEP